MDRFEGPEKKLEIVLSSSPPGLRDNHGQRWDGVVRACGATIIKSTRTPQLDAYLLSESSLFVWDSRILLITCGQTTPVTALPVILEFVDRESIDFLFYERKSANFPQEQTSDFASDEAFLRRYLDGELIRLGGADNRFIDLFFYGAPRAKASEDATLQVLMHDIDPAVGVLFSRGQRGGSGYRAIVERLCSLCDCPIVDGHLFYPQGYSLNAVRGDRYYTVHVTPQAQCSYVSVETNADPLNHDGMVREVVSLFRPRRFSVVTTRSTNGNGRPPLASFPAADMGYIVAAADRVDLGRNYLTTYLHYLEET